MPKYYYKCLDKDCEQVFEVVHSMKERFQTCSQCSNVCDKDSDVEKVPLNIISVIKKNTNSKTKQKTGSLANKSIEEFRQDLKDEKKRLRGKEYK
jgi:hypothetical protein